MRHHPRSTRLRMLQMLLVLPILLAALLAACSSAQEPADRYDYGRAGRAKLPPMTLLNHQSIMGDLLGKPTIPVKTIGILVYDGADTMETIAPMVVFSELMDVKLEYVGLHSGKVSTSLAEMMVEHTIDDIDQLDVLVVPGGSRAGLEAALSNEALTPWLKRIDAGTRLTAGVGYGSVILGRAGLLQNKRIAFDWPDAEANTTALGSVYDPARYTHDGKYWTSGRSTAAIDMSLAMLQAIAGQRHTQAAMLDLEYDPAPPFAGGTPETTPAALLEAQSSRSYRLGELSLLDLPVAAASGTATSPAEKAFDIGILVYEDFFTMDAIGPLTMLSQLPDARVRLIRFGGDDVLKSGRTQIRVPTAAADVNALDALLIPGGSTGTWQMAQDPQALAWIRKIDQHSRYTGSVCSGAWILGATGLLEGRKATTNWYRARQMMDLYGAKFTPVRYVSDGKYWTSAGVSAGIDLSVAMIADIADETAARTAMLQTNYNPQPPIAGGSPEKTDDLVLDMMHQMYDYVMLSPIKEERARRSRQSAEGKP